MNGANLFLYAKLTGDIYINKFATVNIYNTIEGTIYNDGGKVEVEKRLLEKIKIYSR